MSLYMMTYSYSFSLFKVPHVFKYKERFKGWKVMRNRAYYVYIASEILAIYHAYDYSSF
jgi:hypothetical protein